MQELITDFLVFFEGFIEALTNLWAFLYTNPLGKIIICIALMYALVRLAKEIIENAI